MDRALDEANARTQLLDAVEANLLRFPLPNPQPVSSEVVSAAASALPSQMLAGGPPGNAPVCPACGRVVVAKEKYCRTCAPHSPTPPPLDVLPVEPVHGVEVSVPALKAKPRQLSWQLMALLALASGAGVAVVVVGLGMVVWLMWY
jgi:hypothetical protein